MGCDMEYWGKEGRGGMNTHTMYSVFYVLVASLFRIFFCYFKVFRFFLHVVGKEFFIQYKIKYLNFFLLLLVCFVLVFF